MIRFVPKPFWKVGDVLTVNSRLIGTFAVLFGLRNNTLMSAFFHDTTKSVRTAAVASGSGITIWTPAASKVIQCLKISVSGSVAGRYQLTYNAVVIEELQLAANLTLVIPLAFPGLFLYPAAQALAFVNQTGSASDLAGNAWGTEVPA